MNFLVPMTPATTGPQWMPIRKRDAEPGGRLDPADRVGEVERHGGHARRVVVRPLRHAADDHVGVADRLHLLEAVAVDEPVEDA